MKYFVLGTNDKSQAVAFYDALFEGLTWAKIHDEGRMTMWANGDAMFAVAEPFDGNDASNGNGTMLGFNVKTKDEVERIYAKALALGGTCEGKPNVRSGRYSAYFRDRDSNKICLFN
ncbi:VOC family protein [Marinifaba aquimaris]|uniref:VOC family protein n=1 Tax=Marinifaba aquimaris TaxID=2741323 RepID=UPI001FEC15EB|nr:VOC family protein [Marinifaba aquimaris]